MYREIHNQHDIDTLQQDLETVFAWARTWKMKFNASKCQHLSVTKKRKPKNTRYSVDGQPIDNVSSSKYLGITLNGTLTWSDHIAAITSKANSTLGILRRNLSPCTAAVKDRAYKALIRPQLDYASVTNQGRSMPAGLPARPASVDQDHTRNNRHNPLMV